MNSEPSPLGANTEALRFHDVSKVYDTFAAGTKFALKNASFEVAQGQTIAIVGRSGSGKSTVLNLAAGVDVPSSGSVFWHGHDLAELNDATRTRLRRDNVGLVFQFFHLLTHLSVMENVALPELIAGSDRSTYGSRVEQLLARVGLADRANDAVDQLSGGEMQRVAICRALIRRPRFLFADEPTGNLDDATGRDVMSLILQLAAEEASTLIYVTHDHELAALADSTWEIHSGELQVQ